MSFSNPTPTTTQTTSLQPQPPNSITKSYIHENGKGDVLEMKNTTVFFTFGRFQPPTIGHKILINSIEENIRLNSGNADGYVFVSKTQNEPREKMLKKRDVIALRKNTDLITELVKKSTLQNPLSSYEKTYFLKKMYPNTNVRFINTNECRIGSMETNIPCGGIFNIIDRLIETGYENIIMLVGSDRVDGFQRLIDRVNISRIEYGKTPILVKSVGLERDETSSGTEGMSGSKMRIVAVKNQIELFTNGIQTYDTTGNPNLTEEEIIYLINAIKYGVGLDVTGITNTDLETQTPISTNKTINPDVGKKRTRKQMYGGKRTRKRKNIRKKSKNRDMRT